MAGDGVDISDLPVPPQASATDQAPQAQVAAPDISDLPVPAAPAPALSPREQFRRDVGRYPENSVELQNYQATPQMFTHNAAGQQQPTLKQGLTNVAGAGEGALNIAENWTTTPVAGFLTHVGALLATGDPEAAKAVRDSVMDTVTYQPRTAAGQSIAQAPGEVIHDTIGAAWRAAKGPEAKDAVVKASRSAFGDTATDAALSGLEMGNEAINAIPGVAGAAKVAGRGGSVSKLIEPFRGGSIPEGTQFDQAGTAITPKAAAPAGVQEPAAAPPSIDEVLGPKHAPQEPQEAPAPAAAKAAPTPAHEAPAAPEASPEAPAAKSEVPGEPSPAERDRHEALQAVGFNGPVRESAITGDKVSASTDAQVAKADTPKGREAQALFDNESDTLHKYSDQLVDQAGGTRDITDSTARYARGETLASPIQAGYNKLNDQIKQLYQAADERAQGAPAPLERLGHLMENERSSFDVTDEGSALLRGLQGRLREMKLMGPDGKIQPATALQAERLRQFVGDSWSPRNSRLIGKIQDAIDDDVTGHAGQDLYGASRALRRQRDVMYDTPPAVSKLLEPRGGEPRSWALEDVGGHLAKQPQDNLKQYVKVLDSQRSDPDLKPGAEAALHELRGHFAQMIQEAGRPSNAGVGKQAVWDADKVSKVLAANRARMQQVFTPAEMKQFEALDKAGKILKVDRTYKGAVVEGHNIAMRGALFAAEHVPTLAGALLGHGMGAVAGEMAGKRIHGKLEERFAPAVKTRPPLGAQIGGGKQRGAVGDLGAARQTPADRMISNFESVTKEHPTQVGTRAFNGASVELSHDPFDPNTVHIESMRADKGGQGTSSKVLQGLTAMADKHGARLTLDSVPMKPNPGETAIPADKLASIYKAHGFTPTEGGLVEGSAMERNPRGTSAPVKVFHGSATPFETYDPNHPKTTLGGFSKYGMSVSEDPKVAARYAKDFNPQTGGHVQEMRADIQKPLNLTAREFETLQGYTSQIDSGKPLSEIQDVGLEQLLKSRGVDYTTGQHPIDAIKAAGFDALTKDAGRHGVAERETLVFDPSKVTPVKPRPTFGPAPGQAPLGARMGLSQRGAVGNLTKTGATPENVHAVSKDVNPADKPAAEAATAAVDDAHAKAAKDIIASNELRLARTEATAKLKAEAMKNVDPKKSMSAPIDTATPGKSPTMQLADAFDKALANHNSLPLKEKVANSKAARASVRQFVKGDLITQNGKLQKSEHGENIETWGLALSPDYVEGRLMLCPKSGSCRDECLGFTSGQFHAGGGGIDLTAFKGPRGAALNRTFAMLHDPEAFAVRLNDEITAAKHKVAANGNKLGIRLNVLSDLNPRIHRDLILAHPDVQFYDYTKMGYDPVAPNHHYTYSSTGVSQPEGVDENPTNVFNPHQNWNTRGGARDRLDKGDNVAMAFSNRNHLPTEIHDEETGKTYKVVNGDAHDFRPLDKQAPGQPGVIIGLKKKKVSGGSDTAHVDSNGFFVRYDPKELRESPKGKYIRDANGDTQATNHSVTIATQHGRSRPMTDNDLKQLAEKGLEAPWQQVGQRSVSSRSAHPPADPKEPIYARVGDWHPSERSTNNAVGGIENGVSVYDTDKAGNPVLPHPDDRNEWTETDFHDRLQSGEPVHYVQGDLSGMGHDGEPLLKNVRKVTHPNGSTVWKKPK